MQTKLGKNMEQLDYTKPKTSLYIFAWIGMGMINVFISYLISNLLPLVSPEVLRMAIFWQFFMAPISALVPILGFYLAYSVWFKNLNGWRVLPWLYVVGTFGYMGSTGNNLPVVAQLIGQENADYYALISIVTLFISFYIIRKFIVAKSGHVK